MASSGALFADAGVGFDGVPGEQVVVSESSTAAPRGRSTGKVTVSSAGKHTRYLAGDPLAPSTLFVSTSSGLYEVTDASTTPTVTQVDAAQIIAPGPLTFDGNGGLYVTQLVTGGTRLWCSTDGGQKFIDIPDAAHRAQALYPCGIAVGADRYIYVTTDGTGVVVGTSRADRSPARAVAARRRPRAGGMRCPDWRA